MGKGRLAQIYWRTYQDVGRLTGEEAHFLSEDERRRLAGLRFERRRADWLAGRWAIKSLLARCEPPGSGQGMDCIQILNEDSGAPFAVDSRGARIPGCISISHRAGVVFCAYCPDPNVRLGVDLELVEKKEPAFFDDYFTLNEKALALRCEENQRDLAILLAWSGKEAVFKAHGTGLRMDTRSVEIGGYDWIVDSPLIDYTWYDLAITCFFPTPPFRAWWMRRGDYLLVAAVKGELSPITLQEM